MGCLGISGPVPCSLLPLDSIVSHRLGPIKIQSNGSARVTSGSSSEVRTNTRRTTRHLNLPVAISWLFTGTLHSSADWKGSYGKTIDQGAHLPVKLNHSTTSPRTRPWHDIKASAGDLDLAILALFTFRAYRTLLSPPPPSSVFPTFASPFSTSSSGCVADLLSVAAGIPTTPTKGIPTYLHYIPRYSSSQGEVPSLGLFPPDPRHACFLRTSRLPIVTSLRLCFVALGLPTLLSSPSDHILHTPRTHTLHRGTLIPGL